jgi:hypothetical protein
MKSYYVGKLVCVLGAVAAISCGGDGTGTVDPPIVVSDGDYYHYVTNAITLATTSSIAEQQSFDLNGDGTVDLGLTGLLPQVLPLLGADTDINALLQELITQDGAVILLHSVRANDITRDSSTSWQVYLGDPLTAPLPADQFTGTGVFTVAADSPTAAKVNGRIGPTSGGNVFQGGPGNITLQLPLGDLGSLEVTLVATRIKSTVSATGCTGSLGGAITSKALKDDIFPFAVTALNNYLATASDSTRDSILTFIDTDDSGTITQSDLETNSYVMTVLGAYQIDLLNDPNNTGTGPVEPDVDGIPDSIPLAIGFSCTPAKFTASGETGTVIPTP